MADFISLVCRGSPPRMRGKVSHILENVFPMRITPAHAGKSMARLMVRKHIQDHPRACGEKFIGDVYELSEMGSPPRMRGKVNQKNNACIAIRITPAHAGKSVLFFTCSQKSEDHPRACGEKGCGIRQRAPGIGSPPRMRGKGNITNNIIQEPGITPAHAGKSGLWLLGKLFFRDHPRACGEKLPPN